MNLISQKLTDRYRSQLNPLRGLTLQRISALLDAGQRGEYADLQWLYSFIEKRDAVLRGCKHRIAAALGKLDWEIAIVDKLEGADKARGEKHQAVLEEAYLGIENMREALGFLSLAEFRGYAHLEKHFHKPAQGAGRTMTRLEPVPQWHWVRQGLYGAWEFVADASSGRTRGEGINPQDFIIREVADPINEIALTCYGRQNLAEKDWAGFIEVYGIPYLFLILPEVAGDSERARFEQVAQDIAGDARGILPYGTEVKTADAGSRGTNPFKEYLHYQDERKVLAATSGKLTMLTESGSGTLAGSAHSETFQDIALEHAKRISETLQEQLDRPLLKERFPRERPLAYFHLITRDEDDVADILDHGAKAQQAGYRITREQLEEKTGYVLEELSISSSHSADGSSRDSTSSSIASTDPSKRCALLNEQRRPDRAPHRLERRGERALQEAWTHDCAELIERLQAIVDESDPEQAQRLAQALLDELPALAERLLAKGGMPEALERLLAPYVINGAEAGLPEAFATASTDPEPNIDKPALESSQPSIT